MVKAFIFGVSGLGSSAWDRSLAGSRTEVGGVKGMLGNRLLEEKRVFRNDFSSRWVLFVVFKEVKKDSRKDLWQRTAWVTLELAHGCWVLFGFEKLS